MKFRGLTSREWDKLIQSHMTDIHAAWTAAMEQLAKERSTDLIYIGINPDGSLETQRTPFAEMQNRSWAVGKKAYRAIIAMYDEVEINSGLPLTPNETCFNFDMLETFNHLVAGAYADDCEYNEYDFDEEYADELEAGQGYYPSL